MKRSPLRRRSSKTTRKFKNAAAQMTRLLIKRGPGCEVNALIQKVVPEWDGCWHRAQGRHHLRKQSAGGSDHDENVLLSCNPCNDWVESYPDLAHQIGLVIRQGDELWDELGEQ